VWNDTGGSKTSLHARFFGRDGSPTSGEFRLLAPSAGSTYVTSVVVDVDDSFLVAWDDVLPGKPSRVLVQRFDRAGRPVRKAFQVHANSAQERFWGRLAPRPGGGFAITWTATEDHLTHTEDSGDIYAYDAYARVFTTGDAPLSPEFLVTPYTGDDQVPLALGVSPNGTVIVLFVFWDQGTLLRMQRLTPRGRRLGEETPLDPEGENLFVHDAALAMAPDGTFVAAWDNEISAPAGSGARHRISARRFAADGSPLTDPFPIIPESPTSRFDLAALPNGGVVAVWTDSGRDGDRLGIFGRAFGPGGNPLSAHDFQVNLTTEGDQAFPLLAGRNGRFVAAWGQGGGVASGYPSKDVRARLLAGN